MLQKGLFVSHRGQSFCCDNNKIKHKEMSPKDFWNSDVRKNALEQMHNDSPVKGCETCYHAEENRLTSSRTFYKPFDHLPTKPLPTMLDLDFSNFCNLKCVMCNPSRSSQHAKDVGEPVSAVPRQYLESLLEISDEVREITIQGGEPSIMEEFTIYFGELHKKGIAKNVNLQIISNLTNLNKGFMKLLPYFKRVRLSVSLDAYGKANDYIRWPSKFHAIEKNIGRILEIDTIKEVDILNSLTILSMFNYGEFLTWAKEIEVKHQKKDRNFGLTALKVFNPVHYSPFIAPESLKELYINDVKKFYQKSNFSKLWAKTEMMLLCKKLERSQPNKNQLNKLIQSVNKQEQERSVKIQDFIPNFHEHIQKSQ